MKFIYNKNYWSHYYSLIAFFTIFFFGISGAYASDLDKLKEVPCSIVVESKPLRNVFESIEDQTEYNIVCFDQTALLNNKVTINAPKSNLETVLQKIAGIQDISFTLNGKNIIVKPHKKEPAPQKIINSSVLIKGVITDSKNQPVPGATIRVKGTPVTTSSDSNGNFQIEVPSASSTLVVTFVGSIPEEIVVGDKTFLTVRLRDDPHGLNEVVVVGYGSQKKSDLTGAVAQISGEVLEDRPTPNIARGLEGEIPNLNIVMTDGKPIRSPAFNIRGNTSIGSGGAALVLIDGVAGDPSLLNPNDIASISVLKDAAASAIYGARGAFGVVLITTKDPKKGKVQINFNANYTVNQKTVDPSVVSNGYQWAQAFVNSYEGWYDYRSYPATVNGVIPFSPSYLDSLQAHNANPNLPQVTVDPATGKYNYYGNTNWYKQLYREYSPASEYALSVSGGNKTADFYVSGRYYNQGGIYRYNPDNFNRYNLRLKGDIYIKPWLTFTDNVDFNVYNYYYPLTNGNAPVTRYLDVSAAPMGVMYNPDGSLTPTSYNSVGDLATNYDHSNTSQLYFKNTASLNADIIKKYLNLKADFTYAYTNNDVLSQFYPVSYSAGPGLSGHSVNNYLNDASAVTRYLTTNVYAEGNESFGKHVFKLLVGTNIEDNLIKTNSYQRDGLIDPSLANFNLLNGINYTITGGGNEWAIAGFFARLNYAFDDKYLLEVNGRYDGSSKFPSYSQFGFFPSVSAGWVISKEKFMSFASNWLEELKLRGSYGSLGNGNINPYQFIPQMALTQSKTAIINGSYPTYTSQPSVLPDNLTWETSTTLDGGIDFSLLNGRLTTSFDYYTRATTGMFTPSQPEPAVFGAAVPNGNYSNLRTNGWELSMNWRDHISKSVSYSIGVSLSDYISTITKYNNPNGILPYGGVNTYYTGERLGEIWGFTTQGLYTAAELAAPHPNQINYINVSNSNIPMPGDIQFKDLNGDNAINIGKGTLADHGDLSKIGNSQPRYLYGLNLGLKVKNISFSAFIQGVGHQDWWPGTDAGLFWGQYNRPYGEIPSNMLANVWSDSNPNAYWPRYRGYVALSGTRELAVVQTRYLQNAAYMRLKNVNITYSFPKRWVSKLGLASGQIYVTGQNLLTFTPLHKYAPNFDPEVINGSDPEVNANIGNGYLYPMLKSYTVGFNLTF